MNHFITYATQSHYAQALDFRESAWKVGGFDTARIWIPEELTPEFCIQNKALLRIPRHAGLAVWKPHVLLRTVESIPDGDVVVYCDALYRFLADIRPLVDGWLQDGDIGLCSNKPNEGTYPERHWCKADCGVIFGVPIDDRPQVWAGFVAVRKSVESIGFLRLWLQHCQDVRLMSWNPSGLVRDHPEFVQHRSDQAVLSLLAKKASIPFQTMPNGPLQNLRKPTPA